MKTLKKYFKDRKFAINRFLEQPRDQYTPETFHKLRVEIKRLNALFDLIDFSSKDFKRDKTFKPFRKIFRQAGKVRELQIEENIVQNYCNGNCLIDYQNKLKLQQLTEELDYFLIVDKKIIKQLNKKFKVINSFISDVNKKRSKAYMLKMTNKINKDLSKKIIPPRKIHELRKLVKLLIYNTEAIYVEREDSFSEKKALAELLGQWHDLRVIVRRLCEVQKTEGLSLGEVKQLEAIIVELRGESELLFIEINLAMPKSRPYKFAEIIS